jgi:hypothetical protein
MVQAALDDENVLAAIGEGKLAAIGDGAFGRALELRDEAGREVDAFDASEAEALKSDQPVAATAKELDDFSVAPPLRSAETIEARDKFLNLLLGSFETQIGGFPGIGSEGSRNGWVWISGAIFHF